MGGRAVSKDAARFLSRAPVDIGRATWYTESRIMETKMNFKTLHKTKRLQLVAETFRHYTGLDVFGEDVAFFTTDPILIGYKTSTIRKDAEGELSGRPYYAFYMLPEKRVGAKRRLVCYKMPDGWRGSLQRVVADGRLNVDGCTLPWDDYKKYGVIQFMMEL
jgi:hypothetical protein